MSICSIHIAVPYITIEVKYTDPSWHNCMVCVTDQCECMHVILPVCRLYSCLGCFSRFAIPTLLYVFVEICFFVTCIILCCTERPWNESLSTKIAEVQESFKNIPPMLYFSPSSVSVDGIGVYVTEPLPRGLLTAYLHAEHNINTHNQVY